MDAHDGLRADAADIAWAKELERLGDRRAIGGRAGQGCRIEYQIDLKGGPQQRRPIGATQRVGVRDARSDAAAEPREEAVLRNQGVCHRLAQLAARYEGMMSMSSADRPAAIKFPNRAWA